MKYLLSVFAIALFTISAFSQTRLYKSPDFDQLAKSHEVIGIIPFKTSITLRPRQMKDVSPEQLARMEKAEGESIQSAMYTWFLKRQQRGKLTVDLQAPSITNAKLKKAGITIDNYTAYTPSELARIIGVDAIIMGTFETNQPMSEEASVALNLLIGFGGSRTNSALLNLYLYNAKDETVMVNYLKEVSGALGSSTEDLINTLMRKASRRIAYKNT